jgi:hypothetical protein
MLSILGYYAANCSSADFARQVSEAASATDLSSYAFTQALATVSQQVRDGLGLVVGDCTLPPQMIPAEAHRVLERAQLKIKSYDLLSAGTAFALFLQTLLQQKPQNTPASAAFVTSSFLREKIAGIPAVSDGAAAIVVAPGTVDGAQFQISLVQIDFNQKLSGLFSLAFGEKLNLAPLFEKLPELVAEHLRSVGKKIALSSLTWGGVAGLSSSAALAAP